MTGGVSLPEWKNEHALYHTRSEATMQRMTWAQGVPEPAPEIRETVKTLGQLEEMFQNASAWHAMDPGIVQDWRPVVEGMEGGLFWGTTLVEPGHVDSEYFMTHGHFHAKRARTEYYATIEGEGAPILMDESRKTWTEAMTPGSVHFIPPRIAHRVANLRKRPAPVRRLLAERCRA
jgi:glucose-6-phosphate isomerase